MPDWFNGPMLLGGIAGIFGFAAAIWSSIDESKDARELNAKNQLIIEKSDQIIKLQDDLNIAQKNHLDYLTGGNSFVYLNFSRFPDGTLRANFNTIGEYPIRDARFDIFNFTRFNSNIDRPWNERYAAAIAVRNVGTIRPNPRTYMTDFPFPVDGNGDFFITIGQLNGDYYQIVSIRRLAGDVNTAAYRVFKLIRRDEHINIKELPELFHADDNFPRDESNKIEWLDYPDKWAIANLKVVN